MIWAVKCLWPYGYRFIFNCYQNHAQSIVRTLDVIGETIFNREGVTQEQSLATVVYGWVLLPLIQDLQEVFPDVNHNCYVDDSANGELYTFI